jgi:hypothetical protein
LLGDDVGAALESERRGKNVLAPFLFKQKKALFFAVSSYFDQLHLFPLLLVVSQAHRMP